MNEELQGPHPLEYVGKNDAGNAIVHEKTSGARFHEIRKNGSEQLLVSRMFPKLHTARILRTRDGYLSQEAHELRAGDGVTEKEMIEFYADALILAELTGDLDHGIRVKKTDAGYEVIDAKNVGKTDGAITFFDFDTNRVRELFTKSESSGRASAWAMGKDIPYSQIEFLPLADDTFRSEISRSVKNKCDELLAFYSTAEGKNIYSEVLSKVDPFEKFISLEVFQARISRTADQIGKILR